MSRSSKPLGLLVGTSLLETDFGTNLQKRIIETDREPVPVHYNENLLVVQRHDSPAGYRAPHAIDHQSNLLALRKFDVESIVAVNSTGSLQEDLPPGTIVVPDDFISPWRPVTFHDDDGGHGVSEFDPELRDLLVGTVRNIVSSFRTEATYLQTQGPRFETPAEARMFADYADIVGMTAASEVTLACELDIPYATVCMVDNYVNGIAGSSVDMESFEESVAENVPTVKNLVSTLIENEFDLDTEALLS
jgi:5'-methylthioadenosine phosphorylase